MSEFRKIHTDAVPRALEKAERYRLLNEPREAESICRDILKIDESNARAKEIMLLALTDQFDLKRQNARADLLDQARALCESFESDYDRAYLAGVISERWAKAMLDAGFGHAKVLELIRQAMTEFDAAGALAPAGNDDAILRWNTCVRLIRDFNLDQQHRVHERSARLHEQIQHFDDEVPQRQNG